MQHFGATTRVFDPRGLPLPDDAPADHPKVEELRELSTWSEGQVWTSPERHGAMSAVLKAQIDWIPLAVGSVRPTQGETLAVMQVSGGSQSFNAVNQMRVLGRWMRMLTIPNQSSVAKALTEFDEAGRMKPSPYYERVVDVMEELVKFTLLTRDVCTYLTDRYSERRGERRGVGGACSGRPDPVIPAVSDDHHRRKTTGMRPTPPMRARRDIRSVRNARCRAAIDAGAMEETMSDVLKRFEDSADRARGGDAAAKRDFYAEGGEAFSGRFRQSYRAIRSTRSRVAMAWMTPWRIIRQSASTGG